MAPSSGLCAFLSVGFFLCCASLFRGVFFFPLLRRIAASRVGRQLAASAPAAVVPAAGVLVFQAGARSAVELAGSVPHNTEQPGTPHRLRRPHPNPTPHTSCQLYFFFSRALLPPYLLRETPPYRFRLLRESSLLLLLSLAYPAIRALPVLPSLLFALLLSFLPLPTATRRIRHTTRPRHGGEISKGRTTLCRTKQKIKRSTERRNSGRRSPSVLRASGGYSST